MMTASRHDQAVLLGDAAALVRLLGTVAHAHLLDDHPRVELLLAGVTQAACQRIAAELSRHASDAADDGIVPSDNVIDILTRRRPT